VKTRSGFTLVELLIVVIVLGILAVIIVPQFTNAGTRATESSLRSSLQTVRSQIELYKLQHNGQSPTAGGLAFEAAITGRTKSNGTAGTDYGPYLQQMPANPFNNLDTVRKDGADAGANTHGWRFDSTSSTFRADDSVAHASW
jgi:type II secretion system protein G